MVASTTVKGVRAAGAAARLVCADMVSAGTAAAAIAISINERFMREIIVDVAQAVWRRENTTFTAENASFDRLQDERSW